MKHLMTGACIVMTGACIVGLLASPLQAGNLSDPVVEAEMVKAEAESASGKEDGLLVAIWLAALVATVGGAF